MTNFSDRRWLATIVALSSALLFVPAVGATVLSPGQCQGLSDATCPGTVEDLFLPGGAVLLDDTGLQNLTGVDVGGTTRFTADFRSVVYQDPGTGFLSFLYQLTNTGGGTGDSIGRITTIDFGLPVVTDVGACSTCSDLLAGVLSRVDPDFVSRSGGPGSVVEFAYSIGGAHLAPSQSTSVLLIHTMSTQYVAGSTSVLNGGIVNANSFQPVSAEIPEPSTMGLALIGVAGMLSLYRRRRARGHR